jgi:hypothetical protein
VFHQIGAAPCTVLKRRATSGHENEESDQ